MPQSHADRDSSAADADLRLKHQHSASSDQGSRALVPMWDSSDPDRAPPPLPLNPQSPSFTSRAGTSSAIQSAHAALSERARESAALVPALAKRVREGSPEKPAAKGHRRMQSLQPGTVRDMSLLIDSGRNTPGSPGRPFDKHERPSTPTNNNNNGSYPSGLTSSESRSALDQEGSHPGPGPSLTPIVRPMVRRPPPQSILGENTSPQSSTMLALQAMGTQQASRDGNPPLSNVTNAATPTKAGPTLEGLSSQIVNLTGIAQTLQKELSALSRRSRDNATDLLSLKEAATTRDEDIRRSLRDLVGNVSDASSRISSREHYTGLFLDNKPHCTSPPARGSFQLPRIPSPKSFADSIDRGSMSTPSLAGGDGSASIAILEKILRALGTKDGQESLVGLLNELSQKLSGMATASKVDELAQFVREQAETAIVDVPATRTAHLDGVHAGPMAQRTERLLENGTDTCRASAPAGRGSDLLNEDLIKIIQSVKDSVAQGGGMTAEVKALVRELRGEVLGMGRELGKRLEKLGSKSVEESDPPSKDEVSRVIDEGLEQMKEQLNHVLREHRRQSQATASSQKTQIDYQEIYNAMRAALRDNSRGETPDLSRDDVVEAVRDAWENYKPEIEVQQIGLERDEVLTCLKEGIQECMPRDEKPAGATRDEVFQAVVEGLKHFVPPKVETPATLSRDEIVMAVRDCLEEFEFPVAASATGNEITHEDMIQAVKEGLEGLDLPRADALVMAQSSNDEVLLRLNDIMEFMKLEFRAVSDEAKDNVAASGRDTEQVLDATKDGLENLRVAVESYVDRAIGSNGQEEFMENLSRTIDEFKEELGKTVTDANAGARQQLQTELEGLRDIVNSSMVPAAPLHSGNHQEILDALHSGLNSLRQEILRPRPETSEILDAIHDGLNDLHAGFDRVTNKPVDLTANDEILDALREGLDTVRSDIETLRDSSNDRAVAAIPKASDRFLEQAIIPVDMVKQDDIKNLEVLITQLRIKVEAMSPETEPELVHKEDLARLEDMLRNVQERVEEISSREPLSSDEADDATAAGVDAATKDDVEAIETILRNTKSRLDDLIDGEQALRKEHLDAVEALALETKESINSVSDRLEGVSQKEDLGVLENLVTQLSAGVEELKDYAEREAENDDKATKTDIEAVETVVLEIKTTVDNLSSHDFASLSDKKDISGLEAILKEAKEGVSSLETAVAEAKKKLEEMSDASAKAQDDRQAEIVGVADRVSDVKTFLEEFQETVKGKLEEGSSGIESLSKLLESMGEKVEKNENVGEGLREMFDSMKTHFEESKEIVAGARLESNEKLQEATESINTKFDDKVTELIAKYDEFKAAFDEKTAAGEARDIETEAAVVGTKAVADELKLLIDTLGSTVTDSLEKMEEASKTVFEKVEELASRAEELQDEDKTEHEQTRDHVQQAVTAVEDLQGEVKEYQPQILQAVKDLLLLAGEHYEHSKSSANDIQDKIIESKPPEQPMLPPPEKYDDSEVQQKLNMLVEQKYDDSEVQQKLNMLVEQKYDDSEVQQKLNMLVEQKYDDSEVQQKLNMLVEQKYDDTEVRESLSKLIEGKYDDTEVKEKLAQIIEAKYDDAEIKAKLDQLIEAKYDDTEVKEKLGLLIEAKYDDTEVREKLNLLLESKYDDSDVQEKLGLLIETKYDDAVVQEKLNQLIEAKYDDTEVKEKLGLLIDAKYDDTEVKETLAQLLEAKYDDAEVQEKLDQLIESKYDDTEVKETLVQLLEAKYDDTEVQEKLSRLIEEKYDDTELRDKLDRMADDKYDDAGVHEKLDKLVDHSATATEAFSQLQTLEKVHQSVVQTAAEISQFLSNQTQRLTDEHEDREKTLQETIVALERKLAERDHVETSILDLKNEEARLRKSVASLRTDQESLIRQKSRLTGDVSSLETAMRLRKEELLEMEHRAERLERRIVEGVMDHSRVLLMSKSSKDRGDMNRKRVKKPTGEAADGPKPRPVMNLALQTRRNLAPPAQNGASRRIASLSQMQNNMSPGTMKRSQSVRSAAGAGGMRKRSWGGGQGKGFDAEDKENAGVRETVEELEEPDSAAATPRSGTPADTDFASEASTALNPALDDDDDDGHSEAGTLRRSSMGTTVMTSSTGQYDESGDEGASDYSDEYSDYTGSVTGTDLGTDLGTDGGNENGLVLYEQ